MTWLLLDVSYLAHRAMYTTGGLSYKGNPTGALYGMFRTVFSLRKQFGADYVCWAFDDKTENLYRKKLYEPYKWKRATLSSQDPGWLRNKQELNRQINDLRLKHLPAAKVKNIGFKEGYEADDVIAWYTQAILGHSDPIDPQTIIIVTADQDLYQLLVKKYVKVYNPSTKILMTEKTFKLKYGFPPKLWPKYKALAGCQSDNIPGILGIGDVAARKHLVKPITEGVQGGLIRTGKDKIELFERLTKLPFEDDEEFSVIAVKDPEESSDKWKPVFRDLGFHSFAKGD